MKIIEHNERLNKDKNNHSQSHNIEVYFLLFSIYVFVNYRES